MDQLKLQVSGMSCGGCINSITKALQAVPGVGEVKVTLKAVSAGQRHA
ncbi:MAG: heavy-metal-associated domain-containing protein [Chitinivorax sp.]